MSDENLNSIAKTYFQELESVFTKDHCKIAIESELKLNDRYSFIEKEFPLHAKKVLRCDQRSRNYIYMLMDTNESYQAINEAYKADEKRANYIRYLNVQDIINDI